jgi:hypothetical protein
MALSKQELIGLLQNEVRILLHLTTKIDRSKLDYRPTPKQRSTLELLRYLTIMGRGLVPGILTGTFDGEAWGKAVAAADAKDFDAILKDIETLSSFYSTALTPIPEETLAEQTDLFGHKGSRGSFLVNLVLSGHAAYRTQLFLYLKSCGREELNTYNLWQGVDAPAAAAT